MPDIPWNTISELKHELSNARTVLKGCEKICKDSDCNHRGHVLRLLRGVSYHFQNIQDKLEYALLDLDRKGEP